DDEMAFAVERRAPGLQQALISSLQFDRALASGARVVESRELMAAVVADVGSRLQGVPFAAALERGRIRRYGALAAAVAGLFLAGGIADGHSLRLWALRSLLLTNDPWPRYTQLTFRGNDGHPIRLPQGDPLTVHVAVAGPVPDQVFLHYEFKGGDS